MRGITCLICGLRLSLQQFFRPWESVAVSEKTYFRVDKRDFEKNQIICTAGEFMDKHHSLGKQAEKIVEAARPKGKPPRECCLMLFEDENCARKHWAKMSGAKLYEVAIREKDVLHRGDMQLIDMIGEALAGGKDTAGFAPSYWQEGSTANPCFEILTSKATVLAILGTDQERKEEFRRRHLSPREGKEPFEDEFQNLLVEGEQQRGKGRESH
jgi:hypothetical protein